MMNKEEERLGILQVPINISYFIYNDFLFYESSLFTII